MDLAVGLAPIQGATAVRGRPRRRFWRGGPQGSDRNWALAFLVPYLAIFLLFVVYPVGYGLWLGHNPASYRQLFEDPIYLRTLANTAIFLAVGVNLHLFGALMLSGFFMRRNWRVRSLLLVYILPWAVPAIPTFIAFHWMLNGEWGFLNNLLYELFGINGPSWLNYRWLALGSVIVAYIWKWMPFWTVIFLAGRMAIPQELYESAAMDGATGCDASCTSPFPCLPTSISSARCSRPSGHSATSTRCISSPAAVPACPPMCWPHLAFVMPSRWTTRSLAWRR
jgi:multiple sugar transport system permease protein